MTSPTKPNFVVPTDGDPEFQTKSATALGLLPDVATFVDESSDFQDEVYNTPSTRSILPANPGFTVGNSYTPLRANAAGDALTTANESPYSDNGKVVQIKALDSRDHLDGYRRLASRIDGTSLQFVANASTTGDVIMQAVFSGSAVFEINGRDVLRISPNNPAIDFINLDGQLEQYDAGLIDGVNRRGLYVVSVVQNHGAEGQGAILSARVARFDINDIAGAMAVGYNALLDDNPNLVVNISSINGSISASPNSGCLRLITHDYEDNRYQSYIYDGFIQTGSGFNITGN